MPTSTADGTRNKSSVQKLQYYYAPDSTATLRKVFTDSVPSGQPATNNAMTHVGSGAAVYITGRQRAERESFKQRVTRSPRNRAKRSVLKLHIKRAPHSKPTKGKTRSSEGNKIKIQPPGNRPRVGLRADPANFKLNYLAIELSRGSKQKFRRVWLELCNIAQRQLAIVWQLLRIDPTLGARILLKREDIHAAFIGESLTVWQCRAANVTKIFWDYRKGDKCYESVPVETAEGSTMFITPGTRDLAFISPEIVRASAAWHF